MMSDVLSWVLCLREVLLCALVVGAVYADLRFGRVSNWLTFSLGGAGLLLAFGLGGLTGPSGLFNHSLAVLLGVGLFGVPYSLGWFGGGDVKLFAAVGGIKGTAFLLACGVLAGLIGGVMAVGCLAIERWGQDGPGRSDASSEGPARERLHLPYGVAISVGAFLTWILYLP